MKTFAWKLRMHFDIVLDASQVTMKENDAEVAIMALESTLLEVVSQIAKEDEEYQAEQKNYENVR